MSSSRGEKIIAFVGYATILLQILSASLMTDMIAGDEWSRVDAVADERVSSVAIFKSLRVGSGSTCVTLHQVMNETGRWRTHETCNHLNQLSIDQSLLSLRDAETGERLTVDPICDAERDWLAKKMGIPSRVDILSVWDKQCGSRSVENTCFILELVATVIAVVATFSSVTATEFSR
ncbi:hypothetical protein PINS_up019203 [Pythium insidiosum]|nr:hypothetical protein PINS_up019203 [Pythium insidiosum]